MGTTATGLPQLTARVLLCHWQSYLLAHLSILLSSCLAPFLDYRLMPELASDNLFNLFYSASFGLNESVLDLLLQFIFVQMRIMIC